MESHCTDCCCARSWAALRISAYDGKSIPEHIDALRTRLAAAEARVAELEGLLRSHRSAMVCDNLHHSSKQYHLASQKCPVEAEIDAALRGKEVQGE